MTWTRADLSRRLLESGDKSCDHYEPEHSSTRCKNCFLGYPQHLAKSAAEEIGVLDANLQLLTGLIELLLPRGR